MLASRTEIINFIPQRDPFIAVHSILQATEEFAETQFEVLPESIFVTNSLLGEPGLLENIAQTAAAQMGYVCKKNALPIPQGYIASIKNLVVYSLPPVGTMLTTSIKVTNHVLSVILLEGTVRLEGAIVCQCEMRIFIGGNQ
jgi:3-hydroxymyristoyl/3-hydroxydecanoyl-(acyl carrier protein) dehydratase